MAEEGQTSPNLAVLPCTQPTEGDPSMDKGWQSGVTFFGMEGTHATPLSLLTLLGWAMLGLPSLQKCVCEIFGEI